MITTLILSGSNNYGGLILLLLFICFGVPLIGIIIALSLKQKKPKTAKIVAIITTVYVLISIGYCGGIL